MGPMEVTVPSYTQFYQKNKTDWKLMSMRRPLLGMRQINELLLPILKAIVQCSRILLTVS